MPRATKAALAAPNVAVLPTAAPRQVKQPQNRDGRDAQQAFRKANPWPGVHKTPVERRQDVEQRLVEEVTRTPALALVLAVFAALPDDAKRRAAATVTTLGRLNPECPASQQAALFASQLAPKGGR